jgi:hypothetical protein
MNDKLDIKSRKKYEEKGIALIVVLTLIILLSLLTFSTVTFSQISYRLASVNRDRSQSAYWAESAAARTMWLLASDIIKHPTRSLGSEGEEEEEERFLADGSVHTIKNQDEAEIKVKIYDAASGIDISGSNPIKFLQKNKTAFEDDKDKLEEYKYFLNSVLDYVDSNDFVHLNGGFEKDDYEAEGMAPLPRNYAFQYREEILWIPEVGKFFTPNNDGIMSVFRLIPPRGLPPIRGNSNFFSETNSNLMKLQTGLEQEDVESIFQARKDLLKSKTSLADSLGQDVLTKVKSKYSFRESGFYTFIIEASPGKGMAGRIFTYTVRLTRNIAGGKELRYYDWRFLR